MTTEQPNALRLAKWLDAMPSSGYALTNQAAAELRRLHEANQELLEALKLALEWIEDAVVVLSHTSTEIQGVIGAEAEGVGGCSVKVVAAIREALAEQQAQGCDYCNHPQYAGTKCKNCGRDQPAQPSKPLTDDRIWELKTQFEKDAEMKIPEKPFRHVVRAIEAAHGIKE